MSRNNQQFQKSGTFIEQSVVFLQTTAYTKRDHKHISNEQHQTAKYLGINPTKEVKDLYNENF